jgi:hypothetical protein
MADAKIWAETISRGKPHSNHPVHPSLGRTGETAADRGGVQRRVQAVVL